MKVMDNPGCGNRPTPIASASEDTSDCVLIIVADMQLIWQEHKFQQFVNFCE